jgi:hypothetical protein
MSPHSDTLSFVPSQLVFALSPSYCVLSGEATNTNFLFFGLTRPGLEPMIYRTRGKHFNQSTGRVKPKTIKLVFDDSLLSTQH